MHSQTLARQDGVDERLTARPGVLQILHHRMGPAAKGLAADQYRIRLRPQVTHPLAILIAAHLHMVPCSRADPPIEADRSVG